MFIFLECKDNLEGFLIRGRGAFTTSFYIFRLLKHMHVLIASLNISKDWIWFFYSKD
jgi:hypothetical protein